MVKQAILRQLVSIPVQLAKFFRRQRGVFVVSVPFDSGVPPETFDMPALSVRKLPVMLKLSNNGSLTDLGTLVLNPSI